MVTIHGRAVGCTHLASHVGRNVGPSGRGLLLGMSQAKASHIQLISHDRFGCRGRYVGQLVRRKIVGKIVRVSDER